MGTDKFDTGRRNFFKRLGLFAGATAVVASGKDVVENKEENYLIREWKEDGLIFHEYEFPQNVQALFKTKDRKRAIYCPVRKTDRLNSFEHGYFNDLDIETHIHNNTTRDFKEETLVKLTVEQEKLSMKIAKCDEWHIYIVRIKDRKDLFGIMANKNELTFESNAYTVYQ